MERPTPEKHKEFELLCRDFVFWEYPKYNHFTLFGKNGDRQFGCDVSNQEFNLIIQCKCYDCFRKDAYSELENRIEEDYLTALSHFKKMERFVVCTTLDAKASTHEKITSLADKIPIDVWFWGEMERVLDGLYQAKLSYAQEFEAPLFLHKGQQRVCLKNLFVEQKYREIRHNQKDCPVQDNLWNRLSNFVIGNTQLLIIEGDAGCGKTSLVQALCWHEIEQDQIAQKVLRGRPLVTVRLRELLSDFRNSIQRPDQLLQAILNYMNIGGNKRYNDRKSELLHRYPSAVLVLDGFDELCILDGVREHEKLLLGLIRERLDNWSIIVTSRPNYIRRDYDNLYEIIELQHFDEGKRLEWIKHFTDPKGCCQSLSEDLEIYIRNGEAAGVCDAPLTLYLLAAGDVRPTDWENEWRLYHRLFHDELAQRQYDTDDHPGAQDYRLSAYKLAEAVAYSMYCQGNERLFVASDELVEIARTIPAVISPVPDVRTLAERCLALCCYWKSQSDRGAVEFYHNNIRDYFLSEWIWDQLLAIYQGISPNQKSKATRTEAIENLIDFFCDKLCFGVLNDKVVSFLFYRADAESRDNIQSLLWMERERKLIPELFQQLLTNGCVFTYLHEQNLLHGIYKRICCAFQICWAIRKPWLERGEQLLWWTNVQEVNRARIFGALCSMASLERSEPAEEIVGGNRVELLARPFAQVMERCFAHASFNGVRLPHADLRLADLNSANLCDSDIRSADMSGADLRNAHLGGANLCYTNLGGANLCGANLRYASLAGAVLPDGFRSLDQGEQIQHLRKLGITKLVV